MRAHVQRRPCAVAVLALLSLALACGCGSSSENADKQARIEAALRKFEREFVAGKREAAHEFRGKDVLGSLTLVYSPPPKGVSEAEWNAAIEHDRRLRRLGSETTASSGGPATIEVPTPAAVAKAGGHDLTEFDAGKQEVAQTGCLACHRIGANGNPGPGPDLTHVGGRLPKQAIARTLIAPVEPMPSFKNLPPAKFHAIVAFLADLR